jgi:hypothetical protein
MLNYKIEEGLDRRIYMRICIIIVRDDYRVYSRLITGVKLFREFVKKDISRNVVDVDIF